MMNEIRKNYLNEVVKMNPTLDRNYFKQRYNEFIILRDIVINRLADVAIKTSGQILAFNIDDCIERLNETFRDASWKYSPTKINRMVNYMIIKSFDLNFINSYNMKYANDNNPEFNQIIAEYIKTIKFNYNFIKWEDMCSAINVSIFLDNIIVLTDWCYDNKQFTLSIETIGEWFKNPGYFDDDLFQCYDCSRICFVDNIHECVDCYDMLCEECIDMNEDDEWICSSCEDERYELAEQDEDTEPEPSCFDSVE